MRTVNDCTLVPALKTRWPFDTGESLYDRRIVDIDIRCAQRGNRKSRILLLMRPSECDRSIVIRIGRKLQRRFGFGGTRTNFFFGFRSLGGRNNGNTRFDNASFFSRDFGNCFAQPFFVIEIDGRDHRNIRLDGVRSIESAT
jgi:hypothetical protein